MALRKFHALFVFSIELIGLCFVFELFMPVIALAEKADHDRPMNIEADRLEHDDLRQISVFSGNVLLTKGTIVLKGEMLEVRQDPQGFQYGLILPAPGKRSFYRQKREALDEFMEGEAQRIEYDGKADSVTLTGQAELRRLRGTVLTDEMHGQVIVYENLNDQFRVNGKPSRGSNGTPGSGVNEGRVRAVLVPRQREESAK
jgi:lipopolysaccharide export system protein LptA